jgi:hypothetical protein
MGATAPFANEAPAGLEARTRGRAGLAVHVQRPGLRFELAAHRFRKAATLDLLQPVAERQKEEVAAEPRRRAAMQASPFAAQRAEIERLEPLDLLLDRRAGHGYVAWAADLRRALAGRSSSIR